MLCILAGDLEPTATYRVRSWAYLPARQPNPTGRLGTLRIHQRFARGNRSEWDVYAVVRDDDQVGLMGAAYLLLNESDGQGEVYRVILGPVPSCTCRAAQCHTVTDKHLETLQALEAEGAFES